MYTRHVAYGLDLHASFPLPGMGPACADDLPSLAIDLSEFAEVEGAWSGPGEAPPWTGRLGDGTDLTIQQGLAADVLFSYGDRARFHLDPSRERLACAPQQAGLHWQQTLLGRVLPNVAMMRGYEALHASVVDSPEGVVAIAAPSGTGKTTLALELLDRGWPLFADDILILGEGAHAGEARAHAGTPHMNVAVDHRFKPAAEDIGASLGVLAGEHWVAVETNSTGQSRPVRMICLLERGPDLPLAAQPLAATPLPLAPYMLGLADDATREGRRFARYADVMSRASLVRLTGAADATPADLADLLEQALDRRPTLAGEATL